MDIHRVISQTKVGNFQPAYVFSGSERLLIDRAVAVLQRAAVPDDPMGTNVETINSGKAADVIGASRTLPMMTAARFVLVRDVHQMKPSEQDLLADYLDNPSPSTCLVLIAEQLDGRRKLAKAAKKAGVLIEAKPLRGAAIREFVVSEAKARGTSITSSAAVLLIDCAGEELAALEDALERLSLFVGSGSRIDEEHVEKCIARVRTESIWKLVDAVGARNRKNTLVAARSLHRDREPPLRILALVTRQLRLVAKMRRGLAKGLRPDEACRVAGAPPFKASELAAVAKRYRPADLRRAFALLSETDRALKGSKRPPELILEEALLRLCGNSPVRQ